ncbi:MAG: HypC/HybG/HupF family hydrogenase formation chaperone [Candidatus Bathyarchaeia archaeon]
MCLAIPARVVEIKGDVAKVDFGAGTMRDVNISLVEAKVGEYVIVHAGFAIEVLDQKAAEETLRMWNEILNKYEESSSQPNQKRRLL